jgi:hypothetical protein
VGPEHVAVTRAIDEVAHVVVDPRELQRDVSRRVVVVLDGICELNIWGVRQRRGVVCVACRPWAGARASRRIRRGRTDLGKVATCWRSDHWRDQEELDRCRVVGEVVDARAPR